MDDYERSLLEDADNDHVSVRPDYGDRNYRSSCGNFQSAVRIYAQHQDQRNREVEVCSTEFSGKMDGEYWSLRALDGSELGVVRDGQFTPSTQPSGG